MVGSVSCLPRAWEINIFKQDGGCQWRDFCLRHVTEYFSQRSLAHVGERKPNSSLARYWRVQRKPGSSRTPAFLFDSMCRRDVTDFLPRTRHRIRRSAHWLEKYFETEAYSRLDGNHSIWQRRDYSLEFVVNEHPQQR